MRLITLLLLCLNFYAQSRLAILQNNRLLSNSHDLVQELKSSLGKNVRAPREVWNWFDSENHSISLFSHSFSSSHNRTIFQKQHPQLAFIKPYKVGGTSVALALDNAARYYQIKPLFLPNKNFGMILNHRGGVHCNRSSLWYHHGFKSTWMPACIPHTRFVTLLREPLSQTLSWYVYLASRSYFESYPTIDCASNTITYLPSESNPRKSVRSLYDLLKTCMTCRNTPLRRNVTLALAAVWLARAGAVFSPVYQGLEWITSNTLGMDDASGVIAYLETRYFLVGVMERLDEFIAILALHLGWDLTSMYYVECKPNDLLIKVEDLRTNFPALAHNLTLQLAPATEVYTNRKQVFDTGTRALYRRYPHLKYLVEGFKSGLRKFQEEHVRNSSQWEWVYYLDGTRALC